jgi:signal transduction histidine kinase
MKILIAEDDRISLRLLQATLVKWEHDVVATCDGVEAWQRLQADNPPQLAILDWMMPGQDGIEICRKIRQTPALQSMYLILLTARGKPEEIIEGLEAGADDYIIKPFDHAALRARLGVGLRVVALQSNLQAYSHNLEQKVWERTRELEAANRTKSEFLASMSHELRTPLNAVIGFAEVLLEKYFGPLTGRQEGYVKDILDSGQHLLKLIDNILDIINIESGLAELELGEFSIANVLKNSSLLLQRQMSNRGIHMETDIAADISLMVGDERKIKQVLYHLLSNAVKFTPEGGEIRLTAAMVDDDVLTRMCPDQPQFIQITVQDTGIGIAPENQPKIFDPFYQVQGGITDKTPGTGLGLSLCKELVEMHGGMLWVESEGEGFGSRFRFVLPVDASEPRELYATDQF